MSPDEVDVEPAEQEVRALNERYYSRSPALYFRQRLNNLTVCAARLPDYRDALLAGIEVGDLTITVAEHELVDSDLDDDELLAFVTAESEVLLCHATESMFRVYLAHAQRPECPWLRMASAASIRDMRSAVKQRFGKGADESAVRAEVARCLHLDGVERSAWTDDQFHQAVENLLGFLRALAERLEDDKELYNAAKHGLTMFASTAHLQFQDQDGNMLFAHEGPSLEYLHSTPWSGNRVRERQWTDVTVWLNLVGWWALTYVATEIMNSVWTIGRRAFIGPSESDQIWLPAEMTLRDAHTAHGGSPLQRLRRPILREQQDRR